MMIEPQSVLSYVEHVRVLQELHGVGIVDWAGGTRRAGSMRLKGLEHFVYYV